MKTLKRFAFVLAIMSLAIVTPSCKKDSNENNNDSDNPSNGPFELVIATVLNDSYYAVCNVNIEITDPNGNVIVEPLTANLSDVNIPYNDVTEKFNLYTKTFSISKFPATITWKYNMTVKDLHGNYDPAHFVEKNGKWYIKKLLSGRKCYKNGTSQEYGDGMTIEAKVDLEHSEGLPFVVNNINNRVYTIRIDENGNIIK